MQLQLGGDQSFASRVNERPYIVGITTEVYAIKPVENKQQDDSH
jgi:hypothetical protein